MGDKNPKKMMKKKKIEVRIVATEPTIAAEPILAKKIKKQK